MYKSFLNVVSNKGTEGGLLASRTKSYFIYLDGVLPSGFNMCEWSALLRNLSPKALANPHRRGIEPLSMIPCPKPYSRCGWKKKA